MLASKVSFDQMMKAAAKDRTLAYATSFVQVEYGVLELLACWDGFVNTSDAFSQEFKSRKQVCQEFTDALTEYIDYLGESVPHKVGR